MLADPGLSGPETVQASPAALLRRRLRELRESGRDIVDLSSGDPDRDTPAHVVEAAARAAREGRTRYTDVDGTPALKEAVRLRLRDDHGLDHDADEIIAATGSTQVLFEAFLASLAPGDEVVVPVPCWRPYLDQVRLAGGVARPVPCGPELGFLLTPDALRASLGPRTRWLVLNSPANPTGAVYAADALAAIAAMLREHPRVGVISDGLYAPIVFDGPVAPTMAAAVPWMRDRTLTIGGVAKAYGMTGWRIGWAAGPKSIVGAMRAIQSQITSCPSSVSQAAAVAALTGPQQPVADFRAALAARRDLLVRLVGECDGLSCRPPAGAFYLFVSCEGLIGRRTPGGAVLHTDRDVAAHLLDAAGIAVMPGEDFGLSPWIRMSFAPPEPVLVEAGRRLALACARLRVA